MASANHACFEWANESAELASRDRGVNAAACAYATVSRARLAWPRRLVEHLAAGSALRPSRTGE
jgi:hypothetical protein